MTATTGFLPPDVPCGHPGCLHHVSHPCEVCGRVAGRYVTEGTTTTPVTVAGLVEATESFEERRKRLPVLRCFYLHSDAQWAVLKEAFPPGDVRFALEVPVHVDPVENPYPNKIIADYRKAEEAEADRVLGHEAWRSPKVRRLPGFVVGVDLGKGESVSARVRVTGGRQLELLGE